MLDMLDTPEEGPSTHSHPFSKGLLHHCAKISCKSLCGTSVTPVMGTCGQH